VELWVVCTAVPLTNSTFLFHKQALWLSAPLFFKGYDGVEAKGHTEVFVQS